MAGGAVAWWHWHLARVRSVVSSILELCVVGSACFSKSPWTSPDWIVTQLCIFQFQGGRELGNRGRHKVLDPVEKPEKFIV